MKFQKHSHRNKTNRNIIVITVGFFATVLSGGLVYQTYVSKMENLSKRKFEISFENKSDLDSIPYIIKFEEEDTLIHSVLKTEKQTHVISIKKSSKQAFTVLYEKTSFVDTLRVKDTLFISKLSFIKDNNNSLISIKKE